MTGKLYGIGVGPGDPDLLTIKAFKILRKAKVVCYPAPDNGESFARSIVADMIAPDVQEIPIVIPMRVERFPARSIYDEAALSLRERLDAGEDVVVLCEGDPFFYGSFMYVFERLAADYETEIVPGISSLMTGPAELKRPLAARNDVLTVIPGPLEDERIEQLLGGCDAAAIIKIGRHFSRIRALLERLQLTDSAGYAERLTLENQRIMPLASAEEGAAPYFSMIFVYKGAETWVQDLPVANAQPIAELSR